MAWAGVATVMALSGKSAGSFLRECSELAPSTARPRATTLRGWLSCLQEK